MIKRLFHRSGALKSIAKQRKKLIDHPHLSPELRRLLELPLPTKNRKISDLEFLVVDLETTGLDYQSDQILSVGYVVINDMKIKLNSCKHHYVRNGQHIKQEAAIINHILPETLQQGESLDVVMENLFEQMQGRIVVVHGSCVEQAFIGQYLYCRYGVEQLPVIWLDTLRLERSMSYHRSVYSCVDFSLAACRKRYQLPEYPAHSALVDAVAAGELFILLAKEIFRAEPMLLSDLMARSSHNN